MASPTENETAEGTGAGRHGERNKPKKELAKQRKAEARAKAANEDEFLDKLSTVDLADTRQPNNISTSSKITISTESPEHNGSKHEGEAPDKSATKVSDNVRSKLLT